MTDRYAEDTEAAISLTNTGLQENLLGLSPAFRIDNYSQDSSSNY